LIQEVVVDVDAEASEILLVVHWKGGVHTELQANAFCERLVSTIRRECLDFSQSRFQNGPTGRSQIGPLGTDKSRSRGSAQGESRGCNYRERREICP
jgi:hypothetical protein